MFIFLYVFFCSLSRFAAAVQWNIDAMTFFVNDGHLFMHVYTQHHHHRQQRKGLIMLIGIIMYISLFKSEIGSKLLPKSVFQGPLFTFKYGHSFILFVVGCISAEIVGTMNFFLFIRIREVGREKVWIKNPQKCLSY